MSYSKPQVTIDLEEYEKLKLLETKSNKENRFITEIRPQLGHGRFSDFMVRIEGNLVTIGTLENSIVEQIKEGSIILEFYRKVK